MTEWTFRCYLDEHGTDVIYEWYKAQPDGLRTKLETRLRFLRQRRREEWTRPHFDSLDDDCKGLGELRFQFKNVQYRVLGFASGAMEYTWVMVAKEVGGRFVPKNTCAEAQVRKEVVMADRSRSRDCEFD